MGSVTRHLGDGGAHFIHRGGDLIEILVLTTHTIARRLRSTDHAADVLASTLTTALDLRQQATHLLLHAVVTREDAADLVVTLTTVQATREVAGADPGQRPLHRIEVMHQRAQAELTAQHYQRQNAQHATERQPHLPALTAFSVGSHQTDGLVHLAQQLDRLLLQGLEVDCRIARNNALQLRTKALPETTDLVHLRLDAGLGDGTDIARRVATQQVAMGSVELRHGGFQRRSGQDAFTQQQRLLGHLLAEHALRAGDIDGLRRYRHAQVQRHRSDHREQKHQRIGKQKLLIQRAQADGTEQAVEKGSGGHERLPGRRREPPPNNREQARTWPAASRPTG